MSKIMFFDLETTGLDSKANSIHQLSGFIEIDRERVAEFDFKFQPVPFKLIEADALKVSGLTEEDLMTRDMTAIEAYSELITLLSKYVSKYDKKDKLFLCGYNNASFDNQFLREFFLSHNDNYFGSWFWSNSIDVMVLASLYLAPKRHLMSDFKLMTVARTIGIEVDDSRLHDGLYDIELTKMIFETCMKRWYAPVQTPTS